ncbi:accessory Sec system glycosyltransferase GtfB [Lactobacillus colini]|uniref:UDP-N-acetylglucosamine--peptide N-acetylglucosaminyltransferase stabilizing protein GtfB n=1 Tax=Lactobacillus colini TaxID=1819254 RepID=A0ABS4MGP9_9LACO|nr:accessory Sec system glycosylation chaperone GtfB [Lactobacillus colini]MBP2058869.1 accessory Sec system glycosyltransferase GtfB [Lactobacillus colini]
MINLFENFDRDTLDLLRSQKTAGFNIPTVVINDDGFLPKDVTSPINHYCEFDNIENPLYFDKLPVPKFWRIEATAQSGIIYDIDRRRADIYFHKVDNSRLVKQVNWLDESGKIAWSDHYNHSGQKYAKTIYYNGNPVLKKFFNKAGKVVIIEHLVSGDIDLYENHQQIHFNDIVDFIIYYLKSNNYQLDHILYNNLNVPFRVSIRLDQPGRDTLFWHESWQPEMPGNMQYIINNSTRTKHIIIQRYRDWTKTKELVKLNQQNVDFHYLGMIYPHPRGNRLSSNALITTNSDQIEHLDEILQAMPNLHFNIVATTQMSDKLLAYAKYSNVDLYPVASYQKIKNLLSDCDVLFDINHGPELLDTVRAAFEQNMLIVSFKDTIHSPRYISPGNIFDTKEITQMEQKITTALNSVEVMKKIIDTQRIDASEVTIDQYKRTLKIISKT